MMKSKNRTFYTAVGRFRTKSDGCGDPYPVVMINQQEYVLDFQEMSVWTILNWRLLDFPMVDWHYDDLVRDLPLTESRTLEDCLSRLVTRGLVASGTAQSTPEALYDLLGDLYVVPLSKSVFFRLVTFFRLIMLDHVPFRRAKKLFEHPELNDDETQVLGLARQAYLSTAELVKCMERGVTDVSSDEKILEALYNDADTTCDNIADLMRNAKKREAAVMAVANLYLRKMVIFDRA